MTKIRSSTSVVTFALVGMLSSRAMPQTPSLLRWLVSIEKSPGITATGEHTLLGDQPQLRFRLVLASVDQEPLSGVQSLQDQVNVTVERDGVAVAIVTEFTFSAPPSSASLSEEPVIRAEVRIARADGAAFSNGSYAVTHDIRPFLEALRLKDGRSLVGRARDKDTQRLVIRPVTTFEDRIRFHDLEGNFSLGNADYAQAISHLEQLIRLAPGKWQAHAALGAAYLHLDRYPEAVASLERGFKGWLGLSDRRSDVVPNDLARAYLASGRDVDAERVLRAAGVPERDLSERVRMLKQKH